MKTYFCSFANKLFYGSLESLGQSAASSGIFDEFRTYNDIDLQGDSEFWSKHGIFVEKNTRGYGYWVWKPYIVLKTLFEMQDGDVLVYCDAGCTINNNGKTKLQSQIQRVCTGPSGLLGYAMERNIEKTWTKMDLFAHLSCKTLVDTPQIMATTFLICKSSATMALVTKWYELATLKNYTLLDDTPSVEPNDGLFKEHRHDQSIFSLLFKLHGGEFMTDEPDNCASADPIWVTRVKKQGLHPTLNSLGAFYGTDKVSHGFCAIYDSYFRKKRFAIKTLLEIGVFFGSSLLMWRDFFPNALITGMDHFDGKQGNGTIFANADVFWKRHLKEKLSRIALTKTNQSIRSELESFVKECQTNNIQYDIILDDGSHLMKDQQQTLAILFPLIKQGGCFVMEDLHTSQDSGYDVSKDKTNSTLLLLQNIKNGNKCNSKYMTDAEMDYLSTHITSVELFFTNNDNSITGIVTKQ